METRIKTTGYEMIAETAAYLDERLRTIEKHLGSEADTARAEIEIGKSAGHSKHGENWFAEMQMHRPGETMVRVVASAENLNAAIDAAKEEMLGALRKDKTKRSSRLRKTGAQVKSWLRNRTF